MKPKWLIKKFDLMYDDEKSRDHESYYSSWEEFTT